MTLTFLLRATAAAALALLATQARAQADYSLYGVLDFSYGRFEPSGFYREHRFNSNSLTASFVGLNASYALDGGWKPGVTVETFVRFQDWRTGRNDDDPILSRNAFVSLGSDYGTVRVGRLQTLMFDTTARFNAMGNSIAFSPAMRHVFAAGNLIGVQGDFYWNRGIGYTTPTYEGITGNLMFAQGSNGPRGDLIGTSVVAARGLFAAALSAQRVHVDNGFLDPVKEMTWQFGATYNFGWARVFGLYTTSDDDGLDVRSRAASTGVAVPLGPGTLQAQIGFAKATGPAVDRKQTTTSLAYLYAYDSVTDLYVVGMDDRVRGQTRGLSLATGVRFRF